MNNARKPLIAGNWKMHTTHLDAYALAMDIQGSSLVDVLLCPPFTALESVRKALQQKSNFLLGAQNMHPESSGAFTGEISALMLKALGVKYVILGHSERRQIFQESNHFINEKIKSALHHGLHVILCVGETIAEKTEGLTINSIVSQLTACLMGVKTLNLVTIAYEPLWAIGTGLAAKASDAQLVHAKIREHIESSFGKDVAKGMRIIYGGSVKANNSQELFAQPDIDGFLVGGAALDAKEFSKIIQNSQFSNA